MKAEHINIFLEETQNIFNQVAQMNLKVKEKGIKPKPMASKNTVVLIGITGELKGTVVLNIDTLFAMKIASNMMGGMPINDFDELPRSAVCELSNMIMGNVSTRLYNLGSIIDITPPTLLTGENIQMTLPELPLLSIKFQYENFIMDFDISVLENKARNN